jgi:hypothetical protein
MPENIGFKKLVFPYHNLNRLADEELNQTNNNDLFVAQNTTIENDLNNQLTQLHNLQNEIVDLFQNEDGERFINRQTRNDFDLFQNELNNIQTDPSNLRTNLYNLQTQLYNLRTRLHNLQSEINYRPRPLGMHDYILVCGCVAMFFDLMSRIGIVSPNTERNTTLICTMVSIVIFFKMIINKCR